MTLPTILVTGASGTVGSALIVELQQRGIPARAGVRTTPDAPTDSVIHYIPFDFSQPEVMDAALQNVQTLFLLTPNTGDAVDYVRAALKAGKAAGVRHVVRLSAYSDAHEVHNPHRIMDALVIESGMAYTLLQPGPDHDITRILSDLTKRAIQYVNISDEAARASLAGIGLPAAAVEGVMGLYALMRAGKRETVTRHVEAITGQPATSFTAFAHDHASAFTA